MYILMCVLGVAFGALACRRAGWCRRRRPPQPSPPSETDAVRPELEALFKSLKSNPYDAKSRHPYADGPW